MPVITFFVSFFIIYLISYFVRKNNKAKNAPVEKKSSYYNLDAEEAEAKYQREKLIFNVFPYFGIFGFLIVGVIITSIIPDELNHNRAFVIGSAIFTLIYMLTMLALVLIGSGKRRLSNVVIECDCDIVKGMKMLDIRIAKTRDKKTKTLWTIELAHCYVLSELPDWDRRTIDVLKIADSITPDAFRFPAHINVRLKYAARFGDLKQIDSCLERLRKEVSGSFSDTGLTDAAKGGLVEEANIHKLMLLGDYAQAKELIYKHMKRDDVPLAFVYLHYYLAIIALTEGNTAEAAPHIEYIKNNGGTTYYLNDLRSRFSIV